MRITPLRRNILFLLQSILAGLAAAYVFLYFFPAQGPATADGARLPAGSIGSMVETGGPGSYSNAVAISAPGVVNIDASRVLRSRLPPLLQDPIFRRFFGDQSAEQQRNINRASGVIVSQEGYLVTNAHVINNADEILVTLIDGRQDRAEIIGTDPETDLALLKINLGDLPSVPIGDSNDMQVGDVVLAIGNPYDLGQTVTQGIVSAKGRKRLGISNFEDFIQTDADINPGNSGGALINARGQLVGISTAIVTSTGGSQGIGFAIPINMVFEVMRQLLQHGHVIRGYLGVSVIPLPVGTTDINGNHQAGILVEGIQSGGPAAAAGIIPGDIIIEINGVQVYEPQQAFYMISDIKPDTDVDIIVIRGWEEMLLKARIREKPPMRLQ